MHKLGEGDKESNLPRPNTMRNYWRFLVMIGVSMLIMYMLTYLNSYRIVDHARFSETRLFMTVIMGAAMMLVMLLFMRDMYRNSTANLLIIFSAILMLSLAVWLVRSQETVNSVDYMEGMIPHHSIAILTSERADIKDYRVRELADEIIEAQQREIRQMEWLIADIEQNGLVETDEAARHRAVPAFRTATE